MLQYIKQERRDIPFIEDVYRKSDILNLFVKLILFASKAYSFYFYVNPHSYCLIVLNRKLNGQE